MNIELNKEYEFDEYKPFNTFLIKLMEFLKNKKIKSFIPLCGLGWSEQYSFADKVYDTDEENYLIFEDDTVLVFEYNWFSIIRVKITKKSELGDFINDKDRFDFDCYGFFITDYELNRFNDEYCINPSTGEKRPKGGDYFKEIIFHLSNNKKICICPESSISDGYCDIWMENNNQRGIFNGQSHEK